jgi:hypothetical protein
MTRLRIAILLLAAATIGPVLADDAPQAKRPRYAVRGIYDHDFSPTGFDDLAALGFNYIDSGPEKKQLAALAARGLKGFVWLGGYSNKTCEFNKPDEWVKTHVASIAGQAGVGAYFIDDEPNAAACPSAPDQMKARSDLVHSLDPSSGARPVPTFIASYKVDQFKSFAGKVDVIALDHYPCSIKKGCDYRIIDEQIAEADRLGIRYWGVIQAHGDAYYRPPTAAELHEEFVRWRHSKMEGYFVFAWHWPRNPNPSDRSCENNPLWLACHPDLRKQLRIENGS